MSEVRSPRFKFIISIIFTNRVNTSRWYKYKWFCNPSEKIYFPPLRILYLFINSVTIWWWHYFNFVSILSNLVLIYLYHVLFEITFFFKFLVYHPNMFFFTKSAISSLLAKFACAYLAATFPDVNLLKSWVVIYVFFSSPLIFVL